MFMDYQLTGLMVKELNHIEHIKQVSFIIMISQCDFLTRSDTAFLCQNEAKLISGPEAWTEERVFTESCLFCELHWCYTRQTPCIRQNCRDCMQDLQIRSFEWEN